MCYARYLLLVVVTSLALGQILSACGQKGPLYLPKEPANEEQKQ